MAVTILSVLLGVAVGLLLLTSCAKRHALRWNKGRERLRARAIVHEFIATNAPWKNDEMTDALWKLAASMQDESRPKVDEWVSNVVRWTEAGGKI